MGVVPVTRAGANGCLQVVADAQAGFAPIKPASLQRTSVSQRALPVRRAVMLPKLSPTYRMRRPAQRAAPCFSPVPQTTHMGQHHMKPLNPDPVCMTPGTLLG